MVFDPATMLLFVRFLFAFTIGSHILLVSTSIALVFLISVADFLSIRGHDPAYEALARRLTKVLVISFGVGTASGIVMAVELVGLFPSFMTLVASTGAIVLFYAEISAFFLEVLALVLYVYYWNAFKGRYTHWMVSLFVVAGTLASAVFITMVNAWMNTPAGFDATTFINSGFKTISGVQPYAAFFTASTVNQVFHVVVTTLLAGTMVIGSYFAYWYVKSRDATERTICSKALKILGITAVIAIVLAGISGSEQMGNLLLHQPLKYAALEANIVNGTNLPDRFFGTIVNGSYVGGFSVPGSQALLAGFETGVSALPGLNQFPSSQWPPLFVTTTFDLMIAGGIVVGLFLLVYFVALLTKKRPYESRRLLYLWIPAAVLAMVVYQLGWATDEVGRQPWIVYNVMTVAQAANTSEALLVPGILIVAFYLIVIPTTFYFYARIFQGSKAKESAVT
ncbi:MAG TPA: cytochrome ubiquinol oxidase subunit I [Nitrososphaerales archaeon]|nr:cytochrome ubiquinol oxidase subunit I [Nitrososphaerales archaeon]